jgi:hypothetical protein
LSKARLENWPYAFEKKEQNNGDDGDKPKLIFGYPQYAEGMEFPLVFILVSTLHLGLKSAHFPGNSRMMNKVSTKHIYDLRPMGHPQVGIWGSRGNCPSKAQWAEICQKMDQVCIVFLGHYKFTPFTPCG